jgi:hypothetical protein
MGMIEKKDAKETILALSLKDKSEYVTCVQRDLEVIFAEEPKKRGKRIEINPIDDAMIVEDTHEVVKQENE